MVRKLVVIVILILLLAWSGYRYFRHRMDAELAAQWLARDCTVTDQDLFEKGIRDRGEALEPMFIQAFSNGPASAEIDELAASIDVVYKRRQERIRSGQGYKEAAGESLSLVNETQLAENNFDFGYRAAALNGLRIIGRPAGRQLLQRLAAQDSASPFRYLATLYLQR